MTTRQVAFRLKSEGKAEVLRDAGEVKTAFVGAYDASAAAAEKATAASERQERSFRAMAAAARDSELRSRNQRSYNQILGVDAGSGKSARDSAALFEEQAVAMEKAEARAARIRGYLDPAGVALENLNNELRENIQLQKMGLLSTDQLAQAQRLAKTRFDETTLAIENQNKGLTKRALAGRLNLARQGADVAVTAAMGMNPGMIAIQQGPQILDALAESGIKATPALLGLGAAVGVVAGGVAVLGAAWLQGEDAALDYQRTVTGLGVTAGLTASQMEALTVAAADQAGITVKAAREIMTAYLSTGKIGGETARDLTVLTKDWAAMTGTTAAEAQQFLAKMMMEPEKAGRELTRTMGLLDQKTLDQIDSMMRAGDQMGANKLLMDALRSAADGQAEKVGLLARAWDGVTNSIGGAIEKLANWLTVSEGERLQNIIDRRASIERGANGRPLDARTQGIYDTLGAEGSAIQAGRQATAAAQAQRIKNKAEQDAVDRRKEQEEENRRNRVVSGGSRRSSGGVDLNRQREDEQRRREREEDYAARLALQIAQARGDTDEARRIERENALRDRTRQLVADKVDALTAANQAGREQASLDAARAVQTDREIAAISRSRDLEIARIAGNERLVASGEKYADLLDRVAKYESAGAQTWRAWLDASLDLLKVDEARAKVLKQITDDAAAERRLTLARLSGDTAAVERLSIEDRVKKRAQEIEKMSGLAPGEGLAQARKDIDEELKATALGARRAWIRDFVGDLEQGDIGDALLHQLERATDKWEDKLTDMLAKIDWSSMFGGSKGDGGFGDALSKGFNFFFGKNASGTDFWDGGPTWVGERGPELLNLPRGSKITEHDRSMRTAFAAPKGAGGLSLALTYAPVNTISGGASDEVRALLARQEAEFRGKVIATVADAKARVEL